MSDRITDERLRQIAQLEEEIQAKNNAIEDLKKDLNAQLALLNDVSAEIKDLLSRTATSSRMKRGKPDDVLDVAESEDRDTEAVTRLEEAIKQNEKELEELQKEKAALETW